MEKAKIRSANKVFKFEKTNLWLWKSHLDKATLKCGRHLRTTARQTYLTCPAMGENTWEHVEKGSTPSK